MSSERLYEDLIAEAAQNALVPLGFQRKSWTRTWFAGLSFEFESPHAGWLPLRVHVDETEISLDVSDTPNDFLEELIGAVASVVARDGSFRAVAYEEPDRALVVLTRHEGVIVLSLRRHLDSDAIFTFSGTVASVVLPIWRGLRRLQADPAMGEWRWRFPTDQMIRLTDAVDRLKSSAA